MLIADRPMRSIWRPSTGGEALSQPNRALFTAVTSSWMRTSPSRSASPTQAPTPELRLVLAHTPTIGPSVATSALSTSTTMARMLASRKSSTAGAPPGSVCSCPTSAADVGPSTAGQPASSNVRDGAAAVTSRVVSRNPERLKKKGSLRRPVKTRNRPSCEVRPAGELASPNTDVSPAQHCTSWAALNVHTISPPSGTSPKAAPLPT